MQSIYTDNEVLELTAGSYIIHDASVSRFDIYLKEHRRYADIYFISIESKRIDQTQPQMPVFRKLLYIYWILLGVR